MYKKVGKLLVEIKIDKLITKGFIGKEIAKAALLAGMSKRNVHHFSEAQEIQTFLGALL